ncbi:exocyst complex component 7 [Marchantia polymorpha subsp. ruderalis]|uniref:Exocyst subunit Exo70 family protein n=2 Tax=Marchantia polymorpha TaxID=3197 RepID=A0AAF6AKV9_MARPO|nr:hypothetical protein MARPO_0113s0036 [Marchantia polymorpha]BBM97079.1 hypothetical protein Mp_1g02880 [Marchantia polymorpha subsp. ruderalis]|eukprot:PTQ31302.1 hypothetical protein MARPO_0113s0036 [Marchantia polymorpha]
MGLDSSGRGGAAAMDEGGGGYLVAARATLMQTMERTKEMEAGIARSRQKLQGMREALPALEAAMRPLQAQALLQKGLGAKIDRASQPAEQVLRTFEVVRSLERILKGEPRHDLPEYLASLSQLEEAMGFLSGNCVRAVQWISDAVSFLASSKTADKYRMYRLNERLASVLQDMQSEADRGSNYDMGLLQVALGKLDLEFRRILLQHSAPLPPSELVLPPPPTPAPAPADSNSEFGAGVGVEEEPVSAPLPVLMPAEVTETLRTIVERLEGHRWTDNVLEIYRESRLAPIRQTVQEQMRAEYLVHGSAEKIDKLAWEELEGMIAQWTQHVQVACRVVFKAERRLCTRVFATVEKERWIRCWGRLGAAGFLPFLAFGEGVAQSETAPAKLFKLLDMYETMDQLLASVFEVFEGADAALGEIRVRARELQRKVVVRASETLAEFGRSVEEGAGDAPANGERSRLCSYVVNYVKYLVSDFYGPIMAKVLRVHNRRDGEGDESRDRDRWLAAGVQRMMQALEKHVTRQGKSYEDASLGHIFMMNNLWYMVSRVKDSELGPLLGDAWVKDTRGKVRQHTLYYQRETWGRMLAFLTREGLAVSSGNRGATRELARQRVRSFTQSFDEVTLRHGKWVIPDAELREGVELAVAQMVVPAYRSFIQTFRSLLDPGSTVGSRHIKYSPEDLERILDDLFQVRRAQDSKPRNGTTDGNLGDG